MGSEQLVMPVQRVEGLVITEAGDDVLIYDQNSYSLHTLNKQSYQVWQHCDGTTTVDSVAATTGMSADVVKRALTQLEEATLLEAPLNDSLRSNESRRSFMKKAGIVAIPAIVSVSVPLARAAASGCEAPSWCTDEYSPCSTGQPGAVCGQCRGTVLFPLPVEEFATPCSDDSACDSEYPVCSNSPGSSQKYCGYPTYICR